MKKELKNLLIYSFVLSVLFLAICTKSSFLYPFNDWYDANNFLTMGKGIVHGQVPYRDLYEQKGPILYFLHALCYLIPGDHFFGVYLLEVCAFTAFLYYAGKIIGLYLRPTASYWILPILSGLILSSESFCQGDSAEELCACLLMITLYYTLEHFSRTYPLAMPYKLLLLNGLLAGIILWVKYTLLGFHLAFMAVLFFIMFADKAYARAVKSCFVFLGGMAVPSIPVLLYFGANHAVADLFKVYFYNNIFLYDSGKSSGLFTLVTTILLRIGDTFFRNLQFSVFTILGVLAFLLSGKFLKSIAGKLMLLTEAALLAFFIYTGSNFPYYGYILCIFPVLGFVAIGAFAESAADRFHGFRQKNEWHAEKKSSGIHTYGYLLTALICLLFAYYKSPNTYMIGTDKEDLAHYQFAEIMHTTENATLLNYGFLDAGFYTVSDILPSERFFQMQNISYEAFPEMMDTQDACIKEQRVDYVIVRGEEVPEWILDYYEVELPVRQVYEGANVQYILLKKIR